MSSELWALGAVAIAGFGFVWQRQAKRRAQDAAVRRTRGEAMAAFFAQEIPIYGRLSGAQQSRFTQRALNYLGHQRMFYVDTARFPDPVALDKVDETLGWRIAAAAATLSLGVEQLRWSTTRDILVYPTAFDENYESDAGHSIAGMVHAQGPIIFSAQDLVRSDQKEDGYNVGLHELAHVLDLADSYADGSIAGVAALQGQDWSKMVNQRVLGIRSGRYAKLRKYAGTNEAEFFAVAVEAFFEVPNALADQDPELFERLVQTFRFNPSTLQAI